MTLRRRSSRDSEARGAADGAGGASATGPRALRDVVSELFALRGYGRERSTSEIETAWQAVAGSEIAGQTRVAAIKRGVLWVQVGCSAMLHELTAFRKAELLAALQGRLPERAIRDIRFRLG